MDVLQNWSYKIIKNTNLTFKRYLSYNIDWSNRLIIIVGSRGVGKTTLMLQHIKESQLITDEVLYASLDNIYFSKNSIIDLVENFTTLGGKYLFLDEIQKYKNWSVEIKNIYDNYPELKMVLSGSSTTEILHAEGDLSRRALFYKLGGLSFREYLNFISGSNFEKIELSSLLKSHTELSHKISNEIKPVKEFRNYLNYGYYPFFKEDLNGYHQRIRQVLNTVIEVDIPSVYTIDYSATRNIKKMLAIITDLVPFKPNIKKLSEQIGISRESFTRYLTYLEKAEIINLIYNKNKGISLMRKPEKIYLNNTNISYALNNNINIGNARESFFINQLKLDNKIAFSDKGDFLVNGKYTFEVGGKGKSFKQIKGVDNAWIVSDDIEFSVGKKIPLWMFGFLY
jgi:predicted AAA+ superfamily ATPase